MVVNYHPGQASCNRDSPEDRFGSGAEEQVMSEDGQELAQHAFFPTNSEECKAREEEAS